MDKTQHTVAIRNNRYQITEKEFGRLNDSIITEYTLSNSSGLEVSILNYGGIITRILTPDRSGVPGDIALGYDSLEGYLQPNNPYIGCIVGRFANRIANAAFTLNEKIHQLNANNNGNSLHGGLKGFDKAIWLAKKGKDNNSITLSYDSPDGEEGYPGNLFVTVTYTLTENNSLRIDYVAETDKDCPVNLTNHTYFNLSAATEKDIQSHELKIDADAFTELNQNLIPTGTYLPVEKTALDFRESKLIGKAISQTKEGYDHNWILNTGFSRTTPQARLYHPASGRQLEVFTTQPGIQIYTANHLDGTLQHTKKKIKYGKFAGICLETQHFPDSPNQPGFPNTILKAGETFTETTIFRFSVFD